MSISCTVWAVARYWSKIADLNLPASLWRPIGAIPLEFRRDLWRQKTRVPGVITVILRWAILVQCQLVTDRQTNRHTTTAYTALAESELVGVWRPFSAEIWLYTSTQWRKASDMLTSTLDAFLFSSHPKREKNREAHLNYYASAYYRGDSYQAIRPKEKINQARNKQTCILK